MLKEEYAERSIGDKCNNGSNHENKEKKSQRKKEYLGMNGMDIEGKRQVRERSVMRVRTFLLTSCITGHWWVLLLYWWKRGWRRERWWRGRFDFLWIPFQFDTSFCYSCHPKDWCFGRICDYDEIEGERGKWVSRVEIRLLQCKEKVLRKGM